MGIDGVGLDGELGKLVVFRRTPQVLDEAGQILVDRNLLDVVGGIEPAVQLGDRQYAAGGVGQRRP